MSFLTPGRMRTERSTAHASICHASNSCCLARMDRHSSSSSTTTSSSIVLPWDSRSARRVLTRVMNDGR